MFSIYLSQIILTRQKATEGNEITNSLHDPAQNEPKLKISSLCPSVALSNKAFSQVSLERISISSDAQVVFIFLQLTSHLIYLGTFKFCT